MDINNVKITKLQETFTDQYGLSDPSCINKFAWSTIHFSVAESMSCHRVNGDKITPETYHTFHNTPSKIRDRKRMLEGLWPNTNGPGPLKPHVGCEVCREIENAGGLSERIMMNSNHNLHELVPKEIKQDPKSLVTTPTILEVFFGNQCNLGCIYCTPKCSSTIAAENYRFADPLSMNEIKDVSLNRKTYSKLLEAHWSWMKENAHNLRRYHILGGEPFFQDELENNIDFFIENKFPNLEVVIFSNLKVDESKLRRIMDKIDFLLSNKHLKTVSLFCSFDCWGPQIEYIRHGLNLKQWENNFLILLRDYKKVDLFIHSTLTALTFDTFPDLLNKIKDWISEGNIRHTISTVDSRPYLHPGIFSTNFYSDKIKQSISIYQQIIKIIIDSDRNGKSNLVKSYHEVISVLKGYEKTFNNHILDKQNIKKLKLQLDINDFRRKSNWKELWPWLHNYKIDE